ncbi:MAG: hypothetical protein K0S04_858 [Herbinix sp.]|jgi:hypothetical protein|nr:hypothetical protein [Herbinix sp.]
MIVWSTRLFVGDKMEKKKEKVMASINNREAAFGVYCVAFASNPHNLFDILEANELLFPHYKKVNVHIVGLAKGREEAIDLVQAMILEVYQNTGKFDVRNYFT